MTLHDQRDRRRLLARLPELAIIAGCLSGLAWLVADQHDQLAAPSRRIGHANSGLAVAAAAFEWVSMVSFARMQRRLLLNGGQRLAIASVVSIAFAGNAAVACVVGLIYRLSRGAHLPADQPIAGPARPRRASDAAAAPHDLARDPHNHPREVDSYA